MPRRISAAILTWLKTKLHACLKSRISRSFSFSQNPLPPKNEAQPAGRAGLTLLRRKPFSTIATTRVDFARSKCHLPRHAPAQAVHAALQIEGLQRSFARHKEYTRRVSGDAGKATNAVFSPYLYHSRQWQWTPPRRPKSPLLVRISSEGRTYRSNSIQRGGRI